jgi:hypothetical protein
MPAECCGTAASAGSEDFPMVDDLVCIAVRGADFSGIADRCPRLHRLRLIDGSYAKIREILVGNV